MKSICIKVSNSKTINYLLTKINQIQIDNVYFSLKKFKIYNNIIIHYKGNNTSLFLKKISDILSSLIIDLYEEEIVQKLLQSEYFYFNSLEQKQILENTIYDLYDEDETLNPEKIRYNLISNSFYMYLNVHHSVLLKGFITFRIKDYFEMILEQIDKSVNKYIIEQEYTEFISLLKMYINSEKSKCDLIHLVYSSSNPILLDSNKNFISLDLNTLGAKYLSDISFSSNDFALNTLLNLVPKKIYVHLAPDNCKDEFLNTLKLVFEDRLVFCNDCSICNFYKNQKSRIF